MQQKTGIVIGVLFELDFTKSKSQFKTFIVLNWIIMVSFRTIEWYFHKFSCFV